MSTNIVERLHAEFGELTKILSNSGEISLLNVAEDNFRKSLLLAAASYFEKKMTEHVLQFAYEIAGENHILAALIQQKAINRQYHTWFSWDQTSANSFFSLFGSSFSNIAKEEVRRNATLDASIRAFLSLGSERNRLVHQDFGNFTLEKTTEEIFSLFQNSIFFVNWTPQFLRENCRC
ncbi:HEPN domain-containing protein [Klebsiella aerogenes]|uniref:HEPN domain-containing protein n=1 Tax=Klebsiella aerogenes TaxID=548 RepID=UPI00377354DF